TTHYMEEAARLCDVLAIMDHGRIVVEGSPKELVQKYGFYSINFKIASKYPKVFVESLLRVQSVFDISIIDDNLMIISESKKNNMEIIEKIKNISKKNNVNLSLTNVIEPNLESLFLDITGRNLRDTVEESVEERIH
ncbi:MAG: hypothetical protein KAT05_09495, partial [Spirochaetes bacterium]|nr:hypothetical protein [Spirochaetota bacterium]